MAVLWSVCVLRQNNGADFMKKPSKPSKSQLFQINCSAILGTVFIVLSKVEKTFFFTENKFWKFKLHN